MGITRRKFLGWMGAATTAASTLGQKVHAASNRRFEGYPGSFGVLHDITLCIGCRKCEEACNSVNELPAPEKPFEDLTIFENRRRTDVDSFTVVNRFKTGRDDPFVFVKKQCNHCLEPACASACFVKALRKDKTGAVVYDASLCVGCRYCMIACPFDIPAYEFDEPLTPRIRKCHLCRFRIEKGLLPGCVESCPREALVFGDRKSLLKTARKRIDKFPRRYTDHIYGEYEMGGTSWLYLSGSAFSEIGMREDLGTQPASHFTSGPLSAVPIIVGLWPVLLIGIYAVSKRKDKIAGEEREEAIAVTIADADKNMEEKLARLRDKMTREKEAAINLEIKKALEEAAKKTDAVEKGKGGEISK
ncbi:MAG: 4Fe-4S dicluster domain-containing protein [Deltaproteobacteria bacterium]|nr:4Fe-4S dicluster domain-containing protein [Deltaproteobacteria bacterium]